MVILRTSLAALLLVAVAGLAYGGDQKGCCGDPGCDKGKEACPKGCGKMDCCGQQSCCTTKCDVTEYTGNCYKCVCTSVCQPTRPCCPFKDPACGCDKGKGGCGSKGGCGRGCGECGKGSKGGHEGKTCCSTKDGLCCKLGACGNGCGKGCGKGGDKGGCGSKGEDCCDPCGGKAKSDCGCKGRGLLGGLLPGCCACKSRTKKHLYVKSVVVCSDPKLGCGASGKGCGGGKVDAKAKGVEFDAAPDVPEPPAVPVKIGARIVPVVSPVSYTSSASLGSMFK